MKRSAFHRYLQLILALGVSGDLVAAKPKATLQEGERLEGAGKLFQAAQAYARALEGDPKSRKARKALEGIIDAAVKDKLMAVDELEAARLALSVIDVEVALPDPEALPDLTNR